MSDAEIRLRCLELAIVQAKIEGTHSNLDRVAEIQTWFYDRVNPKPEASPQVAQPVKGKVADKSAPKIFS